MFVTVFICVLDLTSDTVTFVNAGHNLPFLQSGNSDFVKIKAKANMVFGMMEDMPYREQTFTLKKGDCLYLYTDGVTEALNPSGEFLGDGRLEEMLNRNRDKTGSVDDFTDTMYREVDSFADGEMQADDITMVFVSRQ